MKLAIINYGLGNLRSVANAFELLGASVAITDRADELKEYDRIVLPGVGAFGDGMKNLQSGGWIPVLEREVREKKKPFLGLCLGMQLLATSGTEHGTHSGLGWIPGVVTRIENSEESLRIPHMGWNDVKVLRDDALFNGVGEKPVFYFVHSYVFVPKDSSVTSAVCLYGTEFVAGIEYQNIFATQFHPEKSQKAGLALLKNFLTV